MYTFKQISDWMNSGQPFTCQVISYDKRRRQGGRLLEYEAVLLREEEEARGRGRTAMEELRELAAEGRHPNHRYWHTRNIRLLVDGHPTAIIKKIHLPLIVLFNDEPVAP